MELRHIRYFQVLAEELNFSRAADKLHIAQPPLSRQIQKLEEEIGAKLFYRTKRQVELTDAGKVFLQKSYEILNLVDQACITTRLHSTGTQGEFKVGFTGTVQDLIPALKKYREQFPQVKVILRQMTNEEQIEALNENHIDIALVSVPIDDKKIQVAPIKKMNFVAALPESHPLVRKSKLTFHDLSDQPLIMTSKTAGTKYYEAVMDAFERQNITPKIAVQAHDLQTVLLLVVAGMGIALTPSPIRSLNGVVHRKIDDFDLTIVGSMAWRKDNKSEVLEKFLDFFFNYYQKEWNNVELTLDNMSLSYGY